MADAPKTPNTVAQAAMDDLEGMIGEHLARSIASLGPTGEAITTAKEYDRWTAKGEASLTAQSPWVLTKTGRIQDLTDEDLEGFDFATDEEMAALMEGETLEEMLAAEPGALPIQIDADFLAWDRVPGPAMDEDDDLPTPIASYDAYVLSHRFKDVMAECETGGNLHNLVSSANVEDDCIPYLVEQAETPAEKACIELAAQLSPGERWAAWLIANGREAEARGRGFDAKNMPPMAISDLRAFIDSLDDDVA